MNKISVREMTLCAMFAAVLCVCSLISFPIGVIPVSLGLFAVLLVSLILPLRSAVLAVVVYLLIGLVGVPVFAGGKAGLPVLVGVTGGYLWSYPFVSALIGALMLIVRKRTEKPVIVLILSIIICEIGVVLCYVCGTIQFSLISGKSFSAAINVCVKPFIIVDLGKNIVASLIALRMSTVLSRFIRKIA